MEHILQWAQHYGVFGLMVISFIESIGSPILPDLILIPMALAEPAKALYFAGIATVASVFGGTLGYGIGKKIGISAAQRLMPARYYNFIQNLFTKYGGWATFIGAITPIPYKFVCITAGTFRVNKAVFLGASLLGRAKRFLLEGACIYYGPQALVFLRRYDYHIIFLPVIVVLTGGAIVYAMKYHKATKVSPANVFLSYGTKK